MSLRDRILAADDIGKQLVEVPEWGVTLEVRTMTAGARASMLRQSTDASGNVDTSQLFARLVVGASFEPETGERVFTDDDVNALMEKSAAAVEKVAKVVMDMSGMTGNVVEDEGKG